VDKKISKNLIVLISEKNFRKINSLKKIPQTSICLNNNNSNLWSNLVCLQMISSLSMEDIFPQLFIGGKNKLRKNYEKRKMCIGSGKKNSKQSFVQCLLLLHSLTLLPFVSFFTRPTYSSIK